MEELISNYFEIPFKNFCAAAFLSNAVVAGSAPLYALTRSFEFDGDLDVWFDTCNDDDRSNVLEGELMRHGYERASANVVNDLCTVKYAKSETGQKISRIETFTNYHGNKRIQFIFVKEPVEDVIRSFDLTCCACWWDCKDWPDTAAIQGIYLAETLDLKFRSLREHPSNEELNRIEKYRRRGFTLIN